MKKGDRIVLSVIGAILVIGGIYSAVLYFDSKPSSLAKVYVYGKLQKEIDLNAVKAPYDFTVENGKGGLNVIHVEKGRICVRKANCPDHVCVKRGYVTSKAAPAVCLPNGVVIEVDGNESDEIDALSE